MLSFEFTDLPTSLKLAEGNRNGKPVQSGSLSFTIRNASSRSAVGRLSIRPAAGNGAPAAWFAFEGAPATNPSERELEISPSASQTVKVTVNVPEGTPGGQYTFGLRVSAENDPDNDSTDSPAVGFTVPPPKLALPPTRPAFPWWAVATAVLVLLVVGGGAWYFLRDGGGHARLVPTDIIHHTHDAAMTELLGMGFAVSSTYRQDAAAVGTVLDSDPKPGHAPADGKSVTLIVSQGSGSSVNPCSSNPILCRRYMTLEEVRPNLSQFRLVPQPHPQ